MYATWQRQSFPSKARSTGQDQIEVLSFVGCGQSAFLTGWPSRPTDTHPCPPPVCAAGLLWSLAPRLAIFLLFYAVGGTWVTAAGFGQRLMHLTYSVLQKEADLRFALVGAWCRARRAEAPVGHWLARVQGGGWGCRGAVSAPAAGGVDVCAHTRPHAKVHCDGDGQERSAKNAESITTQQDTNPPLFCIVL